MTWDKFLIFSQLVYLRASPNVWQMGWLKLGQKIHSPTGLNNQRTSFKGNTAARNLRSNLRKERAMEETYILHINCA